MQWLRLSSLKNLHSHSALNFATAAALFDFQLGAPCVGEVVSGASLAPVLARRWVNEAW